MERMFDCQKIYNYLIINDWHIVKKVSEADLIIINTCSFGKDADDQSINFIQYYLKKKSKLAKIIITGCLPEINPCRLNQIGEFLTISPTDLSKLDDIIKTELSFHNAAEANKISVSEVSYKPIFTRLLWCKLQLSKFLNEFELRKSFCKKCIKFIKKVVNSTILIKSYINPLIVCNRIKFFYLRVSKGCLGNCSYCAKKFSTGTLKSKPLEEIINEFKKGLYLGNKKFYLLSEDIGCYGMDIGTTIVHLLKEMFEVSRENDYKLVISNFNARWFVKYYKDLEAILLDNLNKVLYIQIPIQSGSDRMLKLMSRHYCIEDVERCLYGLKEKTPSLNITTDMIVGFPGETEDDFNMSKEFMKKIKFSYADIFGYEDRPNTLASKMNNKVPQEIIDKRKFELLRIKNLTSKTDVIVKKIIELVRDYV